MFIIEIFNVKSIMLKRIKFTRPSLARLLIDESRLWVIGKLVHDSLVKEVHDSLIMKIDRDSLEKEVHNFISEDSSWLLGESSSWLIREGRSWLVAI